MQGTATRLIDWVVLAVALNSLWELTQLPLYGLWNDPDSSRIITYLIHCIVGDVLITTVLFFLPSMIFRSFDWTMTQPWWGGILITGMGLVYTAFSEWYNVYEVSSWSYASQMPLIAGIGLTPLLQWLVVPALMIIAIRRIYQ